MVKNFLLIVLSYTACLIICGRSDAFSKLDSESDKCKNACASKPLTYEGVILNSCSRGCRLFGICEWISTNLSEAAAFCKMSCNESYIKDKDQYKACSVGCDTALPLSKHRHEKMSNHAILIGTYHNSNSKNAKDPFSDFFSAQDNLDPGFGFSDMMNSMFSSAARSFDIMQRLVPFNSAHHTEVFDIVDGDREEIVVIQYADPVINTPHPTNKKILLNTGRNWFKTTLRDYLETNLQTNVNKKRTSDNDLYLRQQVDQYESGRWLGVKNRARIWWDCVTRKAGLPELILFFFWISVSVILAFTCFVQFRSTPKLSVNGDLAFITDSKGSLPSYMEPYPAPESAKKSPYFLASVKSTDDKVPLPESAFINN